MTQQTSASPWLAALVASHERLRSIVSELDAEGLRQQSYCDDWSIAQVLSHLGSGAEIFTATLASAAGDGAPLQRDEMPAIWDRWNAMSPEEQAEEFLAVDGKLLEALKSLGDRLGELELTMFNVMKVDAVGFLGMRLSEHAVHAWDVAVALDPSATVDAGAVALLVDRLPELATRSGKPEGAGSEVERPFTAEIHTTQPERTFLLAIDEAVQMDPVDAGDEGGGRAGSKSEIHLPSEALVRLLYGRLDAGHSSELEPKDAATVETLRGVFPGF